jgi:hypothetical protein
LVAPPALLSASSLDESIGAVADLAVGELRMFLAELENLGLKSKSEEPGGELQFFLHLLGI